MRRASSTHPFVRAALAALVGAALHTAARAEVGPRGGRVGWGRLVTDSGSWSVHAGNDPLLADFIGRSTTLNIDPVCYRVDPGQLDQLCAYPFVFTNNLADLHAAQKIANVREYLRRGGFIYIDRCVNLSYSLPLETFYERNVRLLHELLPEASLRELPDSHPIYRCFFDVSGELHPAANRLGHSGVYGLFLGGRLTVLLSLASFQCGWPNAPARRDADERMITNIYVYAMTQVGGLEP